MDCVLLAFNVCPSFNISLELDEAFSLISGVSNVSASLRSRSIVALMSLMLFSLLLFPTVGDFVMSDTEELTLVDVLEDSCLMLSGCVA